jgi:hypothetical protein
VDYAYDEYQTRNQIENSFSHSSNNAFKYTCKYHVQIENDKEFQVARRLIGARGSNMKKIIENCSQGLSPDIN